MAGTAGEEYDVRRFEGTINNVPEQGTLSVLSTTSSEKLEPT
jgi:hypothetical protein